MDRVKHENFVRAVAEDNTSLLLAAVEAFRKEALGRIRKGSEASRALDHEMSSRLLHLACRHDAVQCARLLLEGGAGAGGLAPAPVDARDQLTRTPLHVAAETHSARCIDLLLSKNARVDLRVVDGQPLLPLEIALMSRRVQLQWSPDKSIEDLLSFLNARDLTAVRLLAEKTRVVGELAYRYAMEGRVPALAMLLLVVEEKISGLVSVVIEGVRTKRSIYNSIVDEALSMGDAPARDGNERRKALLCEIQLLNQFGSASWRDQYDKRTLAPLLRAAKAGDMNVTKMLLMGNVDVNEVDSEGNTALHWCLSGISRTQEPRIVWLLLKNGARVFQGNKLGLTPVHSAAAKGNYKALQSLLLHEPDCVDIPSKTKETPLFFAVKNGSVECVKLLLRFGADTKARNLRKQRPIELATSQDMRFILSSAKVVPFVGNHSSPQKHRVMSKESCKELMDDTFDGYDDDDFGEECYMGLNKSAYQRDFRSSNVSPQGPKGKSQSSPKQGSKGLPRHNHWPKHDYTRKIFVGGLPPSVDSEYLIEFFTAEFGPVEEAVVIGLQIGNRVQSRGFGFVKFEREKDVISAKEAHHVYMLGKRVEIKDAVARGFLPVEERRASSMRKYTQEFPKVNHSLLYDELIEEHGPQKLRPLPEKCLPSWFFIFRKWLPGILRDETNWLGERKANYRMAASKSFPPCPKAANVLMVFLLINLLANITSATTELRNDICLVKPIDMYLFPRPRQFCPVFPLSGDHWHHSKMERLGPERKIVYQESKIPEIFPLSLKHLGFLLAVVSCFTPVPYILNMADSTVFWKAKMLHVWASNLISSIIYYLSWVIFDIMLYFEGTEAKKTLMSIILKNLLFCLIHTCLLLVLLYRQRVDVQGFLLSKKATHLLILAFVFCQALLCWLLVAFHTDAFGIIAFISMVPMYGTKWLTAPGFKWIPFMLKVGGLIGHLIIYETGKHSLYDKAYKVGIICRIIELILCSTWTAKVLTWVLSKAKWNCRWKLAVKIGSDGKVGTKCDGMA